MAQSGPPHTTQKNIHKFIDGLEILKWRDMSTFSNRAHLFHLKVRKEGRGREEYLPGCQQKIKQRPAFSPEVCHPRSPQVFKRLEEETDRVERCLDDSTKHKVENVIKTEMVAAYKIQMIEVCPSLLSPVCVFACEGQAIVYPSGLPPRN